MFTSIGDICPNELRPELIRLARIEREWLEVATEPGTDQYHVRSKHATWLSKYMHTGADAFGMQALSVFIQDGPKVFRPTVDQTAALEQIEVRLQLHEYAQPYQTLLVDLPEPIGPFTCVLCHLWDNGQTLTYSLFSSHFHKDDIVTTIRVDGRPIEESLQKFDKNVDQPTSRLAGRALRVAANACLALVNFGHLKRALFGKQMKSDQRLANEQSDRGRKARERIKQAIRVVEFRQDVKIHHHEGVSDREPGEPTGREVKTHWRKGHWAMQAHGPKHSLRKRILRKPVLVRADLFGGDKADTSVTYH